MSITSSQWEGCDDGIGSFHLDLHVANSKDNMWPMCAICVNRHTTHNENSKNKHLPPLISFYATDAIIENMGAEKWGNNVISLLHKSTSILFFCIPCIGCQRLIQVNK